jgi:hypothetical protein
MRANVDRTWPLDRLRSGASPGCDPLTQGGLAKKLGKSQPFISQVERAERDIPPDLISAWAEACLVPPSYFRRPEGPLSDSVAGMVHRRMKTLPAKPFQRANAHVTLACMEVDSLYAEVDVEPALEVPQLPSGIGPGDAALTVRRQWRVPDGPLPNLVSLVERAGIPVLLFPHVHLPVSLAGPEPSGSTGPPRRCRGCSRPPLRSQDQTASSFIGSLRRANGGALASPHGFMAPRGAPDRRSTRRSR